MLKRWQIVSFLLAATIVFLLRPVQAVGESEQTVNETQVGFVKKGTLPSTGKSTDTAMQRRSLPSTGEIVVAGVTGIGLFILVVGLYKLKMKVRRE